MVCRFCNSIIHTVGSKESSLFSYSLYSYWVLEGLLISRSFLEADFTNSVKKKAGCTNPQLFNASNHGVRYGEAALWLSTEATNIPIKLFCIMLLGNLIFWMCGLTITAESYFVFLLVLVAGDLSLSAFCDVIVALSSNLEMVM